MQKGRGETTYTSIPLARMTQKLLFHVVISALISQGQGAVNFALNKSANQSSTRTYKDFDWTADKAVDGNSDGNNPDTSRTCSATAWTESAQNHTWEVDIGVYFIVATITVYGRTDAERTQLGGVRLYLGNTSGPWNYGQALSSDSSSNIPLSQYVFKPHNVVARFISLMREGHIMTICEVTVEGDWNGNFALLKSANQSTTLNYNGFDWTADKAVDGNSDGSNPDTSMTCSATIATTSSDIHIWEVDIGVQIIVKTITVYGRTDKEQTQLYGVKLYLGNTSGPWSYSQEFLSDPQSSTEYTKYVFKPGNVIARFISLMRNGHILMICEVTVEGECRRGTYGPGCNEICGNCFKGNNSCSLTDGRCMEGCDAGWFGDICKNKCKAGTYGFGCSETCGHCLNGNNNCSHINGQCNSGCQAGWKGEISCISGSYGSGCNETCGNCYNGNRCSVYDGRCTEGCVEGWHGDICKLKCEAGTYGFNCNEKCGSCLNGKNHCSEINGQCNGGCQAGWTGETCKTECEIGNYGFNCNETCGYCLNGNNSCSKISGQCSGGCQTGWRGEACKTACISGTYGSGCNESCGNCYNGNISCLMTDGRCTEGCVIGWHGDICKLKSEAGTCGFHCSETCGYCLYGMNNCSELNGQCDGGCQAGWTGETCKAECDVGTYGFNCNETCGYCLNGNNSCSKISGQCIGGCQTGWKGVTCKSGMLETVTPGDNDPNTGAIVGSVLAALGVSISATVIIIVIVKKRKRNSNETGTETVTPATNYANLLVVNPDAAIKISVCSREERETAFSAIAEASLQKEMPIGVTNSHSDVMEPDVPVHNVYEKLRDVTESTESPYYTIDHNLLNDQKLNTIENCSNYIETLQELESALKRVEEEISTLRDRKEKLLCKELESSRAIKLRDERKETDSTQSDTYKDSTYVNEESRDALEGCGKYVQMLQSLEEELRMLVEKRKCLFQRKETLLRKELSKTSKI